MIGRMIMLVIEADQLDRSSTVCLAADVAALAFVERGLEPGRRLPEPGPPQLLDGPALFDEQHLDIEIGKLVDLREGRFQAVLVESRSRSSGVWLHHHPEEGFPELEP